MCDVIKCNGKRSERARKIILFFVNIVILLRWQLKGYIDENWNGKTIFLFLSLSFNCVCVSCHVCLHVCVVWLATVFHWTFYSWPIRERVCVCVCVCVFYSCPKRVSVRVQQVQVKSDGTTCVKDMALFNRIIQVKKYD